jgi:hypothetical protein
MMKIVISTVSKYPVNCVPGFIAIGQKMSRIENTVAVRVVPPTKTIGMAVTKA